MSPSGRTWRWLGVLRPFLVSIGAGGVYGSWAAYVHIHDGLGSGVALCAGWTQVGLSICTTLFFVLLLERLFRVPPNPLHGFWLAVTGSTVLTVAWLIVGHMLAGTPHILEAITPSLIIGTAFDFAYAGKLLSLARRRTPSGETPAPARETPNKLTVYTHKDPLFATSKVTRRKAASLRDSAIPNRRRRSLDEVA